MWGNLPMERQLLEQTYDGVMAVTGSRKRLEGGETVVEHDVVLYENVPCGLSLSGVPETAQDGIAGKIQYHAVLFCAPELEIPAGCRVAVTQYGRTTLFRYSGACAMLPTHQQLSVQREDRP